MTWTTLVDGWMKKGDMASAQQVVERMGAAGVILDVVQEGRKEQRRGEK